MSIDQYYEEYCPLLCFYRQMLHGGIKHDLVKPQRQQCGKISSSNERRDDTYCSKQLVKYLDHKGKKASVNPSLQLHLGKATKQLTDVHGHFIKKHNIYDCEPAKRTRAEYQGSTEWNDQQGNLVE